MDFLIEKNKGTNEEDVRQIHKVQQLNKRLLVAIWLLLRENPILPLSFNFNGECMLLKLKKERLAYRSKQKEENGKNGKRNKDLEMEELESVPSIMIRKQSSEEFMASTPRTPGGNNFNSRKVSNQRKNLNLSS